MLNMTHPPAPLNPAELAILGRAGGVHLVRLRGWRLRVAAFVLAILAGVQ
jgi:hypothetical protein